MQSTVQILMSAGAPSFWLVLLQSSIKLLWQSPHSQPLVADAFCDLAPKKKHKPQPISFQSLQFCKDGCCAPPCLILPPNSSQSRDLRFSDLIEFHTRPLGQAICPPHLLAQHLGPMISLLRLQICMHVLFRYHTRRISAGV